MVKVFVSKKFLFQNSFDFSINYFLLMDTVFDGNMLLQDF